MDKVVLDTSALLASLLGERGGSQVDALLLDSGKTALVSTLNWSEVFDRLLREGMAEDHVEVLLGGLVVEIVDFTREQAEIAAKYRVVAPALSLADRACLALATTVHTSAWTADRLWSRAGLPVQVHLVR